MSAVTERTSLATDGKPEPEAVYSQAHGRENATSTSLFTCASAENAGARCNEVFRAVLTSPTPKVMVMCDSKGNVESVVGMAN